MSFNNVTFILHKPQLSENIGACARSMKNFNFSKLTIIKPKPIFPNDKILATSVGAKDIIINSRVYETLESAIKKDAIGATMTKRVKRIGCSTIKDLIEQKKLLIRDAQTIIEMATFIAQGNSFAAKLPNHDDLMMNLVLFGWFTTTDIFATLSNIDMKDMLYKEQLKAIQDDMLPFGFINDGTEEQKQGEGDGQGNIWFEEKYNRFS